MSTRQNSNQSAVINRLAQNLVKLVEMFRESGPASDYRWWANETPRTVYTAYSDYQRGHELFDGVVGDVLKLNPDMLSKFDVAWKLTYEFLKQQAICPNQPSGQELMNKARNHLNELVEFKTWQDVDVPIMNLLLEGEPVKLGYVTFIAATKQDIEQWERDHAAQLQGIADMHVVARVNAPGDMEKAVSYARTQVNSALDVLRMLCFPFYPFTDSSRIGVIGEIPFSGSTPVRMDQKQIITQFRGTGFYRQPEIRKLKSTLAQRQWKLIDELIRKPEGSRNDMENKLLDGIHWLGEAAKPDISRARFAKISFALEALIGVEPKDEELKVRGITAMLAERAAFIIMGRDLADRRKIDSDIRTYYGMRSDIVHGGGRDVPLSDVDSFAILVRRVGLALLEKLDKLGDELSDVDKLEHWARNQRYSLPE